MESESNVKEYMNLSYYTVLTNIVDSLYDYIYDISVGHTVYWQKDALEIAKLNKKWLEPEESVLNSLFNYVPASSKLIFSNFSIRENIFNYYNNLSLSEFCLAWKNYIKLIRYIEKCYFYNPHFESIKYDIKSDIISSSIALSLEWAPVTVSINIEKSEVFDLGKNANNLLDSFLSAPIDIDNSNDKLSFITIDITRDFGNNIHNNFSFVSNSEPIINDDSDARLLKLIKDQLVVKITDSLFEAIKYVCNIAFHNSGNDEIRIASKFDLEHLINHGLYVFKR